MRETTKLRYSSRAAFWGVHEALLVLCWAPKEKSRQASTDNMTSSTAYVWYEYECVQQQQYRTMRRIGRQNKSDGQRESIIPHRTHRTKANPPLNPTLSMVAATNDTTAVLEKIAAVPTNLSRGCCL